MQYPILIMTIRLQSLTTMGKFILLSALVFLILNHKVAIGCDSVIGRQCDEGANRCPDSFTCREGACACRGDQLLSESFCKCVIKAGNIGCMIASQCTDGAYCRHPRKKNGERQWSFCACCSGPEPGSEGLCPPDKCQGYRA